MARLLLLAAAIAIGQLANSMVLPALPLLAREWALRPGQAGLIVTVYFAGFAASGLMIGPLSDRIGRRPLLLGSLALLAAGSLACSLAAGFAVLLACRVVAAAGAAGSPVLSRAIVRDTLQGKELAAALGLLATIQSVSPVVGPMLGGLVIDRLGWRVIFALPATASLLATMAVWFSIGETRVAPKEPAAVIQQLHELLRRRHFRAGVTYGSAFYFAFGAVCTTVPFVLIDHFGLTYPEFGGAFALISAFLALGGIVGPRFDGSPHGLTFIRGAAVLAIGAGGLLLGLTAAGHESVAAIVVCLALFGLAFGLALALGAALTFDDVGSVAGMASSISGFMLIGMAAGGSAIANLLHSGSTSPLAVVLMLAGAVGLLAVRRVEEATVTKR
jgi:DHA1 family bicyclomycin/chloramphenicol resistance-like MFS transporter